MSAYEALLAAPEPPPRVGEGLRALEEVLADHRVVGTSPDGAVTVTVTGAGELLSVVVLDRALRGSHPEQVGPAIVAAVHAARTEAAGYARDQRRLVLGLDPVPGPPAPAPTRPPAARPAAVRPAAARLAAADDGSDLFQGFGSR
jgi:DNA-binding protein YbaB